MLVKEFMKNNPREIVTARERTTIPEAMALLLENKISCLPVVSDNVELIGIISDKDIFRAAHKDPGGFTANKVGDLMTTNLLVGLGEDECDYIAGIMTKNRIRHVPIVDGKKLIGLVSLGDVVKSRMTTVEIENRYLRQYINDQYPG